MSLRPLRPLRPLLSSAGLRRVLPWAVALLIVLGWEIAARSGGSSSRGLPGPWAVATAFWSLLRSGDLWHHFVVSSGRALAGLAIGGGLGLLLGLLTGSFRRVRNLPALVLVPLVLLGSGPDEPAKLLLVAVGVFFPIYLNTVRGIRSVDPGLIEMARSHGLSGWALHRHVILPGALPSVLVGLRFSLGLMWVLLIVAETLSAQDGIGSLTMQAREIRQADVVLVGLLLYALLGTLTDGLAQGVGRRWLRWHPADRARGVGA